MPPINPIYISELVSTFILGGGGLCTALLAYFGVWKKIIQPWMKASAEKRDKMNNVVAHVEDIVTKLDKVSKELMPNGGGSIKDQVKQISEDIKTIMIERDATFYLSKEPMFKSDGNGYYSSVNHAMCQLCGVSENELLGLGWLNYIALEDKDRVWEEWENIMESGKEISLYYSVKNPLTMELMFVKCKAVINRKGNHIVSVIGALENTPKKTYKKLNIA